MARVRAVGIEGAEDLVQAFRKLGEMADSPEAYEVMRKAAKIIAEEIKTEAPGSIKNWVKYGRMPKKKPGRPAAWVRLVPPPEAEAQNVARGFIESYFILSDIWALPYLVEYGTALPRFPVHKKWLRFVIGGKQIFAKAVRKMPKRPFFRRGFDKSQLRASNAIFDGTKALVEKVWQTKWSNE